MERSERGHRVGWLIVLAVSIGAGVALGACGESEAPNLGVTIDLIMDQPKDYYGEVSIVSGEVDDIYDARTFTIGGSGFEEELPVLVPPGGEFVGERTGDLPYLEDDVVQVKGLVRAFRVDEIESDFNLDVNPEVVEDIEEGQPVVVAQSVHLTPRRIAYEEPITDPSTVLKPAQERLSGRRVYFEDLVVDEVLSDTTVFVRNDQQRLLVVLGPAAASNKPGGLEAGRTVSLVGALYPVPEPKELENRFGLDEAAIESLQQTGLYVRAVELTGRTQTE